MAGEKKNTQAVDVAPAEGRENTQVTDAEAAGEKKNGKVAGAASVKKRPEPPQYTADELIAASEKALGVPKECAAAAFKIAGKTSMSLDEAKAVVGRFMKQEVR